MNLPVILVGSHFPMFPLREDFEEDDGFCFLQIAGGTLISHELHDRGGVLNGFCFG